MNAWMDDGWMGDGRMDGGAVDEYDGWMDG